MTTVNVRPSLASFSGSATVAGHNGEGAGHGSSRNFKPCPNCTCSYGQLSRQGRRSSALLKQINSRRHSHIGNGPLGSTSESIYSTDAICQFQSTHTGKRLAALRRQMTEHELCCYVVPSEDEHQSEYVCQADQRRVFISGFTGSAGVACVTRDLLNFNTDKPEGKAVLSTDGRYFNQASQELDQNWTLLRQGEDTLTWEQWCINEAYEMSLALGGRAAKIGIDPRLITYDQVENFQKLIKEKAQGTKAIIEFVPICENLIDKVWGDFEPLPVRDLNDLLYLDRNYSGECFRSKRERVLEHMADKYNNASKLVVSALDEICWLLSLRGSDIEYNPVFFSYLVLSGDDTVLFTDNPFDEKIKAYFEENNVIVEPYHHIWDHLTQMAKDSAEKKDTILISNKSSWEIVRKLNESFLLKRIQSPIEILKAVKNETEIQNAHAAQVKDAVALVQYFSWLEDQLINREQLIDEHKAALKLIEIRKTAKNYRGNSFETISSTGSNAAIIHYAPPEENSSMIDPSKIYLCDSGAQFLEGTTDITRTMHFSKPSKEEINNYTLVLKGNLALERLVFPSGTNGYSIDVIARQFLWQAGLDYKHGTGHGVGSFLNVHEGPVGIGIKPHLINVPLQPGNIVTNEPGFYKDGEYGIRIENDLLVRDADGMKFGDRTFLKFENLTKVPYCRRLINPDLLTTEEKAQVNEFHANVWASVVPFLQPSSIAYKWLKRETKPL